MSGVIVIGLVYFQPTDALCKIYVSDVRDSRNRSLQAGSLWR